jgi:hypothetical protein
MLHASSDLCGAYALKPALGTDAADGIFPFPRAYLFQESEEKVSGIFPVKQR